MGLNPVRRLALLMLLMLFVFGHGRQAPVKRGFVGSLEQDRIAPIKLGGFTLD
jgi:hypothetical protein